jgi:catechol-2,3-dioxygenase
VGPDGAQLGLFADRAPGLRHIALATGRADQQALLSRLDRLAIPYRQERHRDHDSLYFRDPDGTTLEVMVPTGAAGAR